MTSNAFDQWLDRAAAQLPPQREPGQDLWPGIRSRLRSRRRWLIPAAAAAMLALALGAGFWLSAPAPRVPAGFAPPQAVLASARLDFAWRNVLLELSDRQGRTPLSDRRRDVLKAELAQLEVAQTQIRQALEVQPEAEYLVSLLAQTHAQRFYLVQTLAG